MSSGESDKKTVAKPRKKRKTKRCASSPLNDTGCPGKSEGVSSINGQRAGYNKKNVVNGAFINDLNQPHVTSYSNSWLVVLRLNVPVNNFSVMSGRI